MDKKDLSNLEDQIMSTVSNALKAIDFANLKKDINDKTENTLNQVKSKFNGYSEKYMRLNKKAKNDISKYISKRPAGSMSGILYILFGISGCLVYGSSVLIFIIFKILFGMIGSNVLFVSAFLLLVVSVGLLLRGITLRKRVKRFKKYVRFIDDNNYFLINDLAKFAREKESFVVKDLSKMIDLGMFLEGHIDEEKTYFMLNDEVYNDYLNLKNQQIAKEIDNEKLNEEIENLEKDEIESTIKIGRNYIEQIKNIKNELYKEEIAVKLDKLGNISNQILVQVEKNPNKIQEVNKFINHYLPITIKLINSYKDINNQSVQGENIENAKLEIEKSIDLINSAFENLLDDLYEDVVLDISTDISVLKTLFKQEGLTEDDFKK
ncbi:5-bromo-4-chloroindolyl phosphate hydrolysis protein [Paeniclostridium sordellii]|uniref:5-bromo-4-chloroindolyl phosphate hydrolysis family protein n=1 Tax=Paraclostridium sordellii TaxID=1505 RepID=UPI0005DFA005|nr:5-bromo-4-chloroindolyl phosphate hydrolysis family protein [Paeniclostridium sordellii]MCH1965696.1 5-bromo-4-chloroindolyl phosphate hydrolysis family protein [Paeniclostridium sordellii]MDU4412796.1 5-bromo-4-chloroindolyl phosphate hydrolysis family protein [Paeniclostridium sordellii]MRZ30112.1 5-bromo-4-chloroindolyl phosphate hydrolysis protein [Paeniclostridium sordellii]CEQ06472.1 5-bromo-4-chloroindolyl phosphate hydrolysis protein [[Clostridium] sordellii] [Paeniclostridium sordel